MTKYILTVLIFITGFSTLSAGTAQNSIVRIQISNTTEIDRFQEVVEIPLKNLPELGKSFRVVQNAGKNELITQLEYLGNVKPINLLILVPQIPAGKNIILEILAGGPSKVNSKTFGRFVPERKDDFAWENDRVAFRMYGKALENERDNAYGTDIWAKRTTDLIIDKWYKGNDYHSDHGEGLDFYSVGLTLGAGDIAPWENDTIRFSKNYHHYKVFDNGPIRTTFQLGYDDWTVGSRNVSVFKTISLDAGSQLNRIEVVYNISDNKDLDVVMGIVKRQQPGQIFLNEQQGLMAYWEPEVAEKGIMGIGVISPQSKGMKADHTHLMTFATVKSGQPLVYYNGGAWNKAGKIQSAPEWFRYLENFQFQKKNPLQISIL